MTRYSLPVTLSDGSVLVPPLHQKPTNQVSKVPPHRHFWERAQADDRLLRAKLLRDIVLLGLLAVTIISGSAVLVGKFWRDVALADSQVRMVEAEQLAKMRIAEAEASIKTAKLAGPQTVAVVLGTVGAVLVAIGLARPIVLRGP